jgi:BirA family biotin operon repressor/biotin-[acetyl-CoA-carboxylase] ligase
METLFIGQNYLKFDELPSTNSWLMERLSVQDFPEGSIVFAKHQSNGKGQRGASWTAEQTNSLTFSLLLKPTFLPISKAYDLSVCIALALHDCLNELRPGFKIKWPNDIYFEDKKVAGILIENQVNKTAYQNAVVGIGLNVNQNSFVNLPNAISLKQILGINFPVEKVLERLCETIEARYLQLRASKYEALKEAYLQCMYRYNEVHSFRSQNKEFRATIIGVLRSGRLVLILQNGEKRDFDIKEIEFL